jgi:hypothetical protein
MSKQRRWIWIVICEGIPMRRYENGLGYASFASAFGTYEEARKAMAAERTTYCRQREICRADGSERGVEFWTKRANTISIIRIELPEAAR